MFLRGGGFAETQAILHQGMQVVDFFNLERSLQDRFVEAASGSVPPTPIAFKPARARAQVLLWWAVCLFAALASVGLLALGFGSLESPLAIQGAPWAVGEGLLIALAVFSGLRAVALDHDRDSLPFRAGAYVFPIGVVDAQTQVVRIHRFPELTDVSRRDKRVTLVFDGTRFEFETADPALAEQLVALVEQSRQRVSGEMGPPSSRALAALDPLADTGFKSPFTPTEPRRKTSPRYLRFGWLLALLAGAALGPAAWKARNVLSEERLYAEARAAGTAQAYLAYLGRGGQRADVTETLLPRAELQSAIAQGNVAALERFMARGQHGAIDVEVRAALKKALLAELGVVAAKNSLTALNEFERSQAHASLVQKELEQKRAELYQRVVRSFSAAAQPSTPGLVGFVGRLLFYAQKHGPEVDIVFRRREADASKDAEAQLTKSAYFMGPEALPSRYFRPEDWERREAAIGEELAARLNREFPADVLRFKVAPSIADDGTDNPKLAKPTLLITHRDEMSGAFMSKKPRGAFVGLGLTVRSAFLIPGDDQPLVFKFSAWLPPDLKKWEEPGATPKDLYEALAMDGFGRYSKKQLAFLLKAP
ncbi:MAG: hypothetical protein EOO73_08365 [Myxococcales bacterium]|nr:MAG: hypothetical protein EOO73_08365 [Myxococcales bacterium]